MSVAYSLGQNPNRAHIPNWWCEMRMWKKEKEEKRSTKSNKSKLFCIYINSNERKGEQISFPSLRTTRQAIPLGRCSCGDSVSYFMFSSCAAYTFDSQSFFRSLAPFPHSIYLFLQMNTRAYIATAPLKRTSDKQLQNSHSNINNIMAMEWNTTLLPDSFIGKRQRKSASYEQDGRK